jgi:hypothetical protein
MSESSPEINSHPSYLTIEQMRKWNDRDYPIVNYGEEFSVAILGEFHDNIQSTDKQLELIRLVQPEFVLCEGLRGWIYNPKTEDFEKQKNRIFESISDDPYPFSVGTAILTASDEMGFKIIGCDLNQAELNRIEKRYPQIFADENEESDESWEHEPSYEIDTDAFSSYWYKFHPFREEQMVKSILEYKGKSLKPIISILGVNHAVNIHSGKLLQKKGFGYVFIDQSEKDDTMKNYVTNSGE